MGWFSRIFKRSKNDDEPYEEITIEDDEPCAVLNVEETKLLLDMHRKVDKPPPEEFAVEFNALNKEETKVEVKKIKPLDLMKVKFVKAENQSRRRDEVRGICLHHIMMGTFKKNEEFLVSKASGVSAHYLLGRNAELTQMANTSKKAWHSGVSSYKIGGEVRDNLNNCLIGIEVVNPGYITRNSKSGRYWYNCGGQITEWKGAEPTVATIVYPSGKALSGYSVPYPEKQLNKLVALCKALVEKYPAITRDDIVAHHQIAEPEGRKNDPWGLDINLIRDRVFCDGKD